jgi:hypothetical protein
VLDNADDASVLSARASNSQTDNSSGNSSSRGALQHHLSRYLPPSRHGSVLVTSRTRRAASQLINNSDIIPIKPIDTAIAHTLLYKHLGDKGKKSSNNNIAKLAAALDHMPLALVQAAAYIQERTPRCSVQQYLEEYQQSHSRATSLLNYKASYQRRDEAASNAILITWQISFNHVRSSRQSAADLLLLISFFNQQGIPKALIRSQSSLENNNSFKDNIYILRDYSIYIEFSLFRPKMLQN